jgi:hypothetical protein
LNNLTPSKTPRKIAADPRIYMISVREGGAKYRKDLMTGMVVARDTRTIERTIEPRSIRLLKKLALNTVVRSWRLDIILTN